MTFDLIAIGESLRDVFYMIDEASLSCSINKEKCLLCLEYAEKIPVRQVVKIPAAGNSANAAVGGARLGLKTALVTWIGKDTAGNEVRRALRKDKVNCRYVRIDPKRPTSEATILNYQGERTQLVYFQPREYSLPRLASARAVYYSAMGEKHARLDKELRRELDRRRDVFFVFQPGTMHIRRGLESLLPLIARSGLFILNKEEAHRLMLDGERTACNLLESFVRQGAKTAVITDGMNGADAFDGRNHWHMPAFSGKAVERTGAGDSFAIGVAVAMLKELDLPTALCWGTANAWSVVREIGPQKGLLDAKSLIKVLTKFKNVKATKHQH